MIAADPLPALLEVGMAGLASWMLERGQPDYRARQVWSAAVRGVPPDAMLELPATLREQLSQTFRPSSLQLVGESAADSGLTTKLLYRLDGGHTVEAVIMRYPRRTTLCISSQVGCPIGCPFCATGQGPFGRNLRAHEIVEQAVDAQRRLRAGGGQLSHVVFMGMGEPLNNYGAVISSIRQMAGAATLGISPRRMVLSTSGLVPQIARLQSEKLPLTLAVSLHAARDDLRDVLVPVNRRYPLADLVPAARRYAAASGRRVSYEWVMLADVNDTPRDADELGHLLDPHLAHVNLIPFNPVSGTPYRAPSRRRILEFAGWLRARGLKVTVRDTRGREADAACGQLRASVMREARV